VYDRGRQTRCDVTLYGCQSVKQDLLLLLLLLLEGVSVSRCDA